MGSMDYESAQLYAPPTVEWLLREKCGDFAYLGGPYFSIAIKLLRMGSEESRTLSGESDSRMEKKLYTSHSCC